MGVRLQTAFEVPVQEVGERGIGLLFERAGVALFGDQGLEVRAGRVGRFGCGGHGLSWAAS